MNGNVLTNTDANGNIITNTYDALNRVLTSETVCDDSSKNISKSYTYDSMGRTVQTVSNGATTNTIYDSLGRKYTETESNNNGYSVFRGYFYEGVSTYVSEELTGQYHLLLYSDTTYVYDDEMRLIQVKESGNETVSYTYDANGNKASETLANGVVSTYTYNSANKITNLAVKSGNSTISEYEYSYYLDGSDACKIRSENGIIETTSYEYDGLKRLTEESVNVGNTTTDTYVYEYDDYGNRIQMTASGSENYVTEYSYSDSNGNYTALLQSETKTVESKDNALLSNQSNVEKAVYTYDANGNQITKKTSEKTETNTYDGLNQLIGFTDGETTASYTYDISGLRLSKTVDGVTTKHIWNGSKQIIADVVNSQYYEANCYLRGTNLVAKYSFFNGAKSEYTYYTQNAHGDVVNLTDSTGTVTKTYKYDAFGVEKNIDENDTNAFSYCGEYYDAETGTVYLRARYYDPTIGRFISRDSFTGKNEDPLSLNLYTYCANNPLIYMDPSGHMCFCFGFDFCFSTDIVIDTGYSLPTELPNIGSIPTDFVGPTVLPTDFSKDLVVDAELDQAKEAEKEDEEKQNGKILYHYTNFEGMIGILSTQKLKPSLKANNPNDARYGNGQYFTDLNPALYNSSQIARRLINIPNKYKYTYYIAIDVTGLEIEKPANNIYVHQSEIPLDLSGRIVGVGVVSQKKEE